MPSYDYHDSLQLPSHSSLARPAPPRPTPPRPAQAAHLLHAEPALLGVVALQHVGRGLVAGANGGRLPPLRRRRAGRQGRGVQGVGSCAGAAEGEGVRRGGRGLGPKQQRRRRLHCRAR